MRNVVGTMTVSPGQSLEGRMSHAENVLRRCRTIVFAATLLLSAGAAAQTEVAGKRSEERRVGKEC